MMNRILIRLLCITCVIASGFSSLSVGAKSVHDDIPGLGCVAFEYGQKPLASYTRYFNADSEKTIDVSYVFEPSKAKTFEDREGRTRLVATVTPGEPVWWMDSTITLSLQRNGEEEQIIRSMNGSGVSTAEWSPNGRWLVYEWNSLNKPFVTFAKADGSDPVDIPMSNISGQSKMNRWSADGKYYLTWDASGLQMISLENFTLTPVGTVSQDSFNDNLPVIQWSPIGHYLAAYFETFEPAKEMGVRIVEAGTANRWELKKDNSDPEAYLGGPRFAWSINARQVVFYLQDYERGSLHAFDTRTQQFKTITERLPRLSNLYARMSLTPDRKGVFYLETASRSRRLMRFDFGTGKSDVVVQPIWVFWEGIDDNVIFDYPIGAETAGVAMIGTDGKRRVELISEFDWSTDLERSADGRWLFRTVFDASTGYLWWTSANDISKAKKIKIPNIGSYEVAFAPNTSVIIAYGNNPEITEKTILLIDADSGEMLGQIEKVLATSIPKSLGKTTSQHLIFIQKTDKGTEYRGYGIRGNLIFSYPLTANQEVIGLSDDVQPLIRERKLGAANSQGVNLYIGNAQKLYPLIEDTDIADFAARFTEKGYILTISQKRINKVPSLTIRFLNRDGHILREITYENISVDIKNVNWSTCDTIPELTL